MSLILVEILGKYALIYIDDIVIYSKTAENHVKHIETVLTLLQKHGLKVKFSKTQLFQHEVEFLGFLVSKNGLKVNPRKLEAAMNFPQPTNVKAVQAFLGLVGYFRTFIADFATRAKHLYNLLKQQITFCWGEEQEQSFNDLKRALQQAPVLALPDFNREFILTTDASGYAIGAILTQVAKDGKEKLISCHSRTLKDAETRYSTLDREILAVYYGVSQNNSYLWGSKFVIRTDNSAVPYLDRSKSLTTHRAIRWFIKLSEYDYKVEHKKGKTIAHADAISRYPCDMKTSDEIPEVLSKPHGTIAYLGGPFLRR